MATRWWLKELVISSKRKNKHGVILTLMSVIPSFIKLYLWDVDIEKLDLEQHGQFIAERVLEYGNEASYKWLKENYPDNSLRQVICKSRVISPKTANFYAKLLGVSPREVRCLKKPFTQKQKRF